MELDGYETQELQPFGKQQKRKLRYDLHIVKFSCNLSVKKCKSPRLCRIQGVYELGENI